MVLFGSIQDENHQFTQGIGVAVPGGQGVRGLTGHLLSQAARPIQTQERRESRFILGGIRFRRLAQDA